jgi:hypothetical protein
MSSRVLMWEVLYQRSIKLEGNLWRPLQNHLLGGKAHTIWNVATRLLVICHLDSLAFTLCCALPLHLVHNPDTLHKNIKNKSENIQSIFTFFFVSMFFIFEGCILLRLLLQSLGAPSIATVFFNVIFITISYPLHVSTPTGHLHEELFSSFSS